MSTTVSYKGNTIATLSNETKTLTTAGTWVEGNIEIVDVMEDFIVLLSYNSTTEMWEPDVTFTEIQSAHTSGKNIYIELVFDNHNLNYSVDGRYTSNGYEYVIHETGNDLNGHYYIKEYYYVFNSNGLNIVDNYIYYDTSDSDVIALKVASGTTFYGSTGYAVGTAPIRSLSDLTVSGATVTAPAGFYSSDATKSVASGTEGTPTATKGTVSNHQVTVTPGVTNTAGYITGGTKTGTAVTVTASELASGNKEITSNGTNIDVIGYSTVSVAVPSTIITDTTDTAGGTIHTITTTDEVHLQTKTITPTSSQQTVLPDTGYDGFSSVIVGASSGGREDLCEPKDVDFIDYDGRLVYSYTANEFLALASLPANPTNEGLVAQGWNWTLTDAQNFVGKYGALVVGQNYTTSDGKTRIYATIPQSFIDANKYLRLHLWLLTSSSVTIDWGDNTVETISNTGTSGAGKEPTHTYSQSGNYVITISVTGTIHLGYYGANHSIVDNDAKQRVTVNKIEIGNNVTKFARQPFAELYNLVSISIPTTVSEIDTSTDLYVFSKCYHLKGVVFPSGFVGREQKWFNFNELNSLKYISVPKSMTKIQVYPGMRNLRKLTICHYVPAPPTKAYITLDDSPSLTHFVVMGDYESMGVDMCRSSYIKKLFVPETVNYIGNAAFIYNSCLEEIHLLPETPPTLANTNAFDSISSNAVFYVPYSEDHSILDAYKTATNWSTYASRIQEESQS